MLTNKFILWVTEKIQKYDILKLRQITKNHLHEITYSSVAPFMLLSEAREIPYCPTSSRTADSGILFTNAVNNRARLTFLLSGRL